ncbi:MAG: hypothetical protein JW760_14960 [Spirochaetales bacterium]|nr:hypothetical protein [Spirochaetales bacterium]
MKTKIGKHYILIPLIYIAIIGVLLHFQYSTDESFTRIIGNLTVTGEKTQTAITGKRGLSDLQIETFGFAFSFDDANPVLIETRDGLVHKAYALDFTPYSDGIDIDLGKGTSIRFFLEDQGLRILPAASMIDSITRIHLPVTPLPGISLKRGSGLPVLAVTDDLLENTFFASLQEGINYQDEGYFTLESGRNGFSELTFRSAPPGIEDPFTFWFAGKANFPTEEEYTAAVGSYLSEAAKGWETARFSRSRGTWQDGQGSEVFSEDIAVILLSEAAGTNRLSRVQEDMTIASADHKDALTRRSSPFLGDIINRVDLFLRKDNRSLRYQTLLNSAREGNADIFLQKDLGNIIESSANKDLKEEARKILREQDHEDLSVAAALGMIDFILRFENEDTEKLLENIINNRIIPALVVLDSGVYLSTGDKDLLDIESSVYAGYLLRTAGEEVKSETFLSLGRSLITAALSLAEQNGFLPESLTHDGLSVRRETGVLPPEKIYLYLKENPYYPRERSLADYFGNGSWSFSSAETVAVTPGQNMYSISFTYPRGETHYIALHGIPPFSRMRLLGIDWKGDPIFQYYYSGWYYDPDTSTLFIKLRHRTERETIEIYYEQPEPSAAAAEPAAAE